MFHFWYQNQMKDVYPIKANGNVDAVADADEAEDEPITCDGSLVIM